MIVEWLTPILGWTGFTLVQLLLAVIAIILIIKD